MRETRSAARCSGEKSELRKASAGGWAAATETVSASRMTATGVVLVTGLPVVNHCGRIVDSGRVAASFDSPPSSERILQPNLNLAHREGR